MGKTVPLIIVHHANQYLITDGYDNREGISQIAEGYASVLRLHQAYQVPCYLHLSGTLIEALAWHAPQFLQQVKELRSQGIIQFVGGTYSENIMTCFDEEYNKRQLQEYFQIFERHFGNAKELKIFWVPERIWETSKLSPIISDASLPNGGYQTVVLDRRLQFPLDGATLTRARVDAKGPWNFPASTSAASFGELLSDFSKDELNEYCNSFQIRPIAQSSLEMLPICENLRYWIPPRSGQDYDRLKEWGQKFCAKETSAFVFADDLERVAGVGGWDKTALQRFEKFMGWMKSGESSFEAVHLNSIPSRGSEVALENGTFFELAHTLKAGENYRLWADNDDNRTAKKQLESAIRVVQSAAESDADPALLDLAWKHVLAAGYETYWHEDPQFGFKTSPWAAALASHARHAHVILNAAKWFGQVERGLSVETLDVDGDGETEILLKNENIYAVLSPENGGRILWLFWKTGEGAKLMIGNPTDDWNFQSELNRFMHVPANHPGVFCDKGAENARFAIVDTFANDEEAIVVLQCENAQALQKKFVLKKHASEIAISYVGEGPREINFAFSPDYLHLLRVGRKNLDCHFQNTQVDVSSANIGIELQLLGGSGQLSRAPDVGHGIGARFNGSGDVHFLLTCRKVRA